MLHRQVAHDLIIVDLQLACFCIILLKLNLPNWRPGSPNYKTRKRFSEKPIFAFTNSTVFILDFYIFGQPFLFSCFGLGCLDFEESSYNQLPGSLSPDYKYLHARQIYHKLSDPSQTKLADCIRYIIGVFCYYFKSQKNILA